MRAWVAAGITLLLLGGCGGDGTTAGSSESSRPRRTTDSSGSSSSEAEEPGTSPSSGSSEPTTGTAEPGCTASSAIEGWPLRRRLGQLLMLGVGAESSGPAQEAASLGVGGIFLGGNGTGALSDHSLVGLTTSDGVPLAVAVDEEGGAVQRIDDLDGSIPTARRMARDLSADEVRDLAKERGDAMKGYGVTVDFAPVLDVAESDSFIGSRSFANDPDTVATYGTAFARGLADAGITPTFKHFPGHGRAEDSHQALPTTPDLADLEQVDLVPFRMALDSVSGWVMVGHLAVPGLTDGEPASLSSAAINGYLRDEVGFGGVVVSDELAGMLAVSDAHSIEESVRLHLAAGGDVALWNGTPGEVTAVLDHLEGAVADGSLDEAAVNVSVVRVLVGKGLDPCTL